jgi:hypothetical protein
LTNFVVLQNPFKNPILKNNEPESGIRNVDVL